MLCLVFSFLFYFYQMTISILFNCGQSLQSRVTTVIPNQRYLAVVKDSEVMHKNAVLDLACQCVLMLRQ